MFNTGVIGVIFRQKQLLEFSLQPETRFSERAAIQETTQYTTNTTFVQKQQISKTKLVNRAPNNPGRPKQRLRSVTNILVDFIGQY